MVLKELIFKFLLWAGMVVLKELILTVSTLGGCCSLERTGFYQFLHWEGVVVLKELILTVSTLEECGGHERTEF